MFEKVCLIFSLSQFNNTISTMRWYRILIWITIQRGLRNKMIDMIIEKIVSWQDIQLKGHNNSVGTRNHNINCYESIYKLLIVAKMIRY